MLNRRKDRKNYLKKVYVFASLIMLLMVVGYAALVKNLNIGGTANIDIQWDIYIQSVTRTNKTSGATETNQPSFTKLSATFNVDLALPGDSIEYDIVIKNAGKLEAILKSIDTSIAQSNTGLTYTYSGIQKNSRISANNTKTMHLKFYWPSTDTSVPQTTTQNLSISLKFEQAVPISELPILRTTTGSTTQFLGHSLTKVDVESITIVDSKTVPAGAIDSWDASSAGNGTIMAYTLDADSDSKYELYIGGDGGVQANATSNYLFSNFKNVTSITGLDNLYTDNATNMSNMFQNCSGLTNLDLSSFNTSNVQKMSSMFESCDSLTSLDLSSFNTSNVQTMGSMFESCDSLTSLDLSSFNTSNVTNMIEMFGDCINLTSLDLSNFNTSSLKYMSSMFRSCSNLTNLDLSSFNTSSVTEMDSVFVACLKLTTTINITTTSATYNNIFLTAATQSGAQITVNYTSANSSLVDSMIATKSSGSNVVKGNLITS